MTRSSNNWAGKPGGWDSTNVQRRQLSSGNTWGFPDLEPAQFEITKERTLLSYTHRDDGGSQHAEAICHFFLDDYRFEAVWNKPDTGLGRVRRFWATMTPDFSMYTDWPVIIQQWNHYRSLWVGRYWQEQGVRVIPTINWSDRTSFNWCFLGFPKDSVVAIAIPDGRQVAVLRMFRIGFWEMMKRLEPRQIIVYGRMPFRCDLCIEHPPDWLRLRDDGRLPRARASL